MTRPRVVGLAQRVDADARAVREVRRLRERYGPGPVQLRLPGKRGRRAREARICAEDD